MSGYTDEELIRGLRGKDPECVKFFYREFFCIAQTIVEKNSGSHEDAEDIFQDGLIALYKKCTADLSPFRCTLRTYFYSICKNLWFQRLERRKFLFYRADLTRHDTGTDCTTPLQDKELSEEKLEKSRLYQVHFLHLPADCQKVLWLFLKRKTCDEIAAIMGFKNSNYAKTRKYLCKNMLRKMIMKDPRCKRYLDYE